MALPARRITYILSNGDSEIEAGASSDGAEVYIKDTYAAKQVRIRSTQSATSMSNVELTWASQIFEDPFEAPGEKGLRVYLVRSDDSAEISKSLEAWMQQCGFQLNRQAGPILVNNTVISWSEPGYSTNQLLNTTCLNDLGLEKSDIPYAMRLRLNVHGDSVEVQESSTFYYPFNRTEILKADSSFAKSEVGIFSKLKSIDSSECFWSGRTRLLGQADKSKPVVVSDSPQHVSLETYVNTTLSEPQGLHPDLILTMPNIRLTRPDLTNLEQCKLYAKIDLPNSVFMDLYQLQQEGEAFKFRGLWGNEDLEAPVWTVDSGSTSLLELNAMSTAEVLEYKIPIHLRYAVPGQSEYGYSTIYSPQVFYSCPSASESREVGDSFGFPGVFGEQATYYHFESNKISVSIPRLQSKDGFVVASVSLAIMALSLFAILLTGYRCMKTPAIASTLKKKRD